MDEKPGKERGSRLNRRRFIGALGATAAAGAFLTRSGDANAESESYYYQDSFGNIVAAGQGAIDLGVYPPPVPASVAPTGAANPGVVPDVSTTGYTSGYPKYNILLIVVDQMRNPAFWLPAANNSWTNTYAGIMPNITALANQSFLFPNYFVAATVCVPSRACLLTGLYSQQTCIFKTTDPGADSEIAPPLLPYNSTWSSGDGGAGFPTIANVLSQSLPIAGSSNSANYNCAWIGKWHVSCLDLALTTFPGANGPSDFGFSSAYNLPTANTSNPYPAGNYNRLGYPSSDGQLNGGTGGDFLDSYTQTNNSHDVPSWNATLYYNNSTYVTPPGNYSQLNDAAIAWAFNRYWLPSANANLNVVGGNNQLGAPWFCAVSFINPHDISDFPFPFNITSNNISGNFVTPVTPSSTGYQPPPISTSNATYYGNDCYAASNNSSCGVEGDVTTIMAFPSLYATLPPGTGNGGPWNWENQSSSSKPGLQQYFEAYVNNQAGIIQAPGTYNNSGNSWPQPAAWTTFLNYYTWLQACVDYQVGQVLGTNPGSNSATYPGLAQYSTFWENTVIIFTSDHGDYGGSHGLHAKGGALYDEVLNVPLIISYPSQRSANQQNPVVLPYLCSSVDLLPFLYSLALGNDSWRTNSDDMIYYLAGREAIADPIYRHENGSTAPLQHRRISGIPLGTSFGSNNWAMYQPFVLHTTDEFPSAPIGNNSVPNFQPCHAIAFRTLDQTVTNNNAAPYAGQTSYGGGKLGIYSFWDTVDAANNGSAPPIVGINNNSTGANNQYEFYNYSPLAGNANPQEVGNQYLNGANISSMALPYYNDFFNLGSNNGINIQDELYQVNANGSSGMPTEQVQAASNTAFVNYILYLECTQQMTGNNGRPVSSSNSSCSPIGYSS